MISIDYFPIIITGPRPLNTILVIKPYAVRRHLTKILKRTIQENFTIVAMKLTVLTKDQAKMLLSKADQQVKTLMRKYKLKNMLVTQVDNVQYVQKVTKFIITMKIRKCCYKTVYSLIKPALCVVNAMRN